MNIEIGKRYKVVGGESQMRGYAVRIVGVRNGFHWPYCGVREPDNKWDCFTAKDLAPIEEATDQSAEIERLKARIAELEKDRPFEIGDKVRVVVEGVIDSIDADGTFAVQTADEYESECIYVFPDKLERIA